MVEPDLDANAVKRAVGGDKEAFADLCELHRKRLWRVVTSVANGADAEELAQEAVVRAFCSRHTYRSEAPFGAWLCRIAVNVAHDYRKSAWIRRVLPWQHETEEVESDRCVHLDFEVREMRRRVRQEVAGLPESQRTPLWLRYFEGYTVPEISRLVAAPESTVRSRMQAGLRRLAEKLPEFSDGTGTSAADARGYGS